MVLDWEICLNLLIFHKSSNMFQKFAKIANMPWREPRWSIYDKDEAWVKLGGGPNRLMLKLVVRVKCHLNPELAGSLLRFWQQKIV